MTTEIAEPQQPSPAPADFRAPPRRRAWMIYAGIAVGSVALVLLWSLVLKDRFIPKKWGVVVPGLAYRSGQISRYLVKQTLQNHQIQHIICMTSPDAEDGDQQEELRASKDVSADFVYLPLNGRGVGKVEHFTQAVTLLAKNIQLREPVLVHCHAGAQRTGGVVAAYRLLIEKRTPEVVVEELEAYGWNRRRDQILLDFINQNLKKAAEELVAAGCLERVPDELPVLK
ncbi:MAG: tyrosine phosphatase [Planctomycetaceae bacterium]|nr:tyrosine phosphatase [Planctomycetaceae bacterium]